MHKVQSFAQRRPQVIGKFGWRGASATLLAIHHNEIRHDASFDHGFHERNKLEPLADA